MAQDEPKQPHAAGRSQEVELAEKLKRLSIGANDRITWAVGRPDSRVSYYLGARINPLYTPMEMAARRRGRLEIPQDILIEGAKRIIDRLKSDREEYFIFEADELAVFKRMFDVEYTEVLRTEGSWDDPGDALVVITNEWNTGEEEDWHLAKARTPPPVFRLRTDASRTRPPPATPDQDL